MCDGVCQIRRAGVSIEGLAQLDLKADAGAFDWNWFLSQDNMGKEVLATALVAISSGRKVWVQMETTTTWSRVQRFLLIK
jgi:hypothetical protein